MVNISVFILSVALNAVQISIAIVMSGFTIALSVLSSWALCCKNNKPQQQGNSIVKWVQINVVKLKSNSEPSAPSVKFLE